MANSSTLRKFMTGLIALAVLGVAAHAYSVTPSADRISAQDGGTATPAATAGELVVVPGVVQKGQTVLAVGFHVAPFDLEVAIRYSGHFTPEGESCDNAGTAGATQAAVAPTWVTLNACTAGDGYVRMVESATGNVIKDVSVTVIEPGVTGEQARVSVTISGLASTELTPGGSGAPFSVRATGLQAHREYNLHTVVLNNLSVAFNRGCTTFRESDSIVGQTSTTESYTVYGCVAPGNRIWSWVEDSGGRSLASTSISANPVNVKDPTVNFSSDSYSVNEGSKIDIPIILSHRSSNPIRRVPIKASLGTGGSVTFNNRSTSENFPYTPPSDPDCENETAILSFGTPPSTVSVPSPPPRATITILDDDACASFGSDSYSVDEGDSVNVTVNLSRASSQDLEIPVTVTSGRTGRAESTDYVVRDLTNGKLLIPDGERSAMFTIHAEQDVDRDDETVNLSIGTLPSGVVKGTRTSATVTILDDEDVSVSFEHTSYTVREGESIGIDVELNGRRSRELEIPIDVDSDDADSDDYSVAGLTNGKLTFSAWHNSETFWIDTEEDEVIDDDETVDLGFGALPSGVRKGTPSSATVTIDEPGAITASFALSSYTVSEGSARTVTVNLSREISQRLEIPITVTRGRAESRDYVVRGLTSGKLIFSAGDASESFTIEAVQDLDNDDETLGLEFGAPPPGVVKGARASATVIIMDDEDVAASFDSLSYSVDEETIGIVKVSLDGESSHRVVVPIRVYSVDAESGDYDVVGLTNGRLIFDAWETSKTFNVRANMDDDVDDETVSLGFGTLPSGVVQGSPSSATLTIQETNVPPTFREGMDTTRLVAENTVSNTDIGSPVSATDADNDTLTYSLSGTDAGSFEFDGSDGQIRTSDPLDFENKNSYSVTVTADDGNGGTASIDVTIDVTDVNEAPVGTPIGDRTLASNVASLEIDLSIYFSDPDTNDTLTYSAETSEDTIATVGVNGTALTLTAVSGGRANIMVTAADRPSGNADRLMISQTFAVIVAPRPPDQPAGLKAEAMIGGRGIELKWDPSGGAAGYEVEISPTPTVDEIDISGLKAEVTGLTPGTVYTFKVLACNPCGASGLYSLPSIPIGFEAPEPTNGGHHADHIVEYVTGHIGSSVVSDAVEPAVSAWNFAIARLGKGLEICTGPGCVNPDGFTVKIKTVNNNNDAVVDNTNYDEGCGIARACVKKVLEANTRHLREMHMIFENPPWGAKLDSNGNWKHTQYVWTKYKYKNMLPVTCPSVPTICATMPARYYVYVDRIMLHEFGHTLGLSDFYNDNKTDLISLPNAVMHTGYVITGEDLKQLEAIYLLHDPH